jgi:hypothetical protein
MEKLARKYILDNIQSAIYNKNRLIREISSYTNGLPSISQFLENNGQDIRLLYKGNSCWTSLKRDAGRISYPDDEISQRLVKGMSNLIHYNTPAFLYFVEHFATGSEDYLDKEHKTYALMLYYALFQDRLDRTPFSSIYEALGLLHQADYQPFKQEITEITAHLRSHLQIQTTALGDDIIPKLELYGCYTREDIFILAGRQTEDRRMQGSVTGVFNLPEHHATLLFVTLNKSDRDFSPSTQYDDYLINEEFFHWQSQNTDSHENQGGKRYTQQTQSNNRILLFVRQEKKDGFGNTSPFHCFGLVEYVSSHGDQPMNIKWKLQQPAMAQYLKVV